MNIAGKKGKIWLIQGLFVGLFGAFWGDMLLVKPRYEVRDKGADLQKKKAEMDVLRSMPFDVCMDVFNIIVYYNYYDMCIYYHIIIYNTLYY